MEFSNIARRTRGSNKNPTNFYEKKSNFIREHYLREVNPADNTERFGITFSAIDKTFKKRANFEIRENELRKNRLLHLNYNKSVSKENSSDNDSVKINKQIALIRTPYSMVPKIKINKRRTGQYLYNQYLQKDRLTRINTLLLKNVKFCDDINITKKFQVNKTTESEPKNNIINEIYETNSFKQYFNTISNLTIKQLQGLNVSNSFIFLIHCKQ